jgi:hypothetical protein
MVGGVMGGVVGEEVVDGCYLLLCVHVLAL